LIEECERNSAALLRNLARSANVHAATAGRKLRREGYLSFKKAVVSKIADPNKPKRVRWCQERRDWKLQWRKAVFVDETQVPNSGGAGSGRVRRKAGQRMDLRQNSPLSIRLFAPIDPLFLALRESSLPVGSTLYLPQFLTVANDE
jgi:hypothetical protein